MTKIRAINHGMDYRACRNEDEGKTNGLAIKQQPENNHRCAPVQAAYLPWYAHTWSCYCSPLLRKDSARMQLTSSALIAEVVFVMDKSKDLSAL